jgi:glycosyltransferase involved in cell wall biosynthesis
MNALNRDPESSPLDEATATKPADGVLILMPVYDDWESAEVVLRQFDQLLQQQNRTAAAILVDDGSSIGPGAEFLCGGLKGISTVEILRLRRNLGHQRAIAVGLTYIYEQRRCESVLVMDADGEDKPEDGLRLLAKLNEEQGRRIVFAARTRRSESLLFRVLYRLYCLLHLLLTGIRVSVGNFSAVPFGQLARLTVSPEIWSHYAAAVFHSRIGYTTIPTERGHRVKGQSRMNFVALVTHGLKAISVYSDIVGVRLLILACAIMALVLAGIVAMVAVGLAGNLAVPSWAPLTAGLLLVVLTQVASLLFGFVLFVLYNQQGANFLPLRDYRFFIESLRKVHPA